MAGRMQWSRQQKRGQVGRHGGQSAHMARVKQQQALSRQAREIDRRRLGEKATAKPISSEPES